MRNSYEKYENSTFLYKKALLEKAILVVKSSLQLKLCHILFEAFQHY